MAVYFRERGYNYFRLPKPSFYEHPARFCWSRSKDDKRWYHSYVLLDKRQTSLKVHRKRKAAKARALSLRSAYHQSLRRGDFDELQTADLPLDVGPSREALLSQVLVEAPAAPLFQKGDRIFALAAFDLDTGQVRFNRDGMAALFLAMRQAQLADCPICGSPFNRSNGITTCPQATCRASSPRFVKRIMNLVEKAVPDTLPMDVHDDAYQELAIAAMTKKILLREIQPLAPKYIRQAWKQRQGLFDRSLDAPMASGQRSTTFTLMDVQSSGGIPECQLCGAPLEYGRLCEACTKEAEQRISTNQEMDTQLRRRRVRRPKGKRHLPGPPLPDHVTLSGRRDFADADEAALHERAVNLPLHGQ